MEQTGLVGFFSILSRPSQLLTFSPSLDEGFIRNYNINRKQKKTRAVNWCLSLCSKYPVIARPVCTLVVAIPRLKGTR